jgi:hypothetical protein
VAQSGSRHELAAFIAAKRRQWAATAIGVKANENKKTCKKLGSA